MSCVHWWRNVLAVVCVGGREPQVACVTENWKKISAFIQTLLALSLHNFLKSSLSNRNVTLKYKTLLLDGIAAYIAGILLNTTESHLLVFGN